MLRLLLALLFAIVLATSAGAQNLVSNPGFEDPTDFADWTVVDAGPVTGVVTDPSLANSGDRFADSGFQFQSPTFISQQIVAPIGQYQVSFFLDHQEMGSSFFEATFDGVSLMSRDQFSAPTSGYDQFSFLATATNANPVLEFTFFTPFFMRLDDVSVVAFNAPVGVPEVNASTAAIPTLLLLGLLTMLLDRRSTVVEHLR